MLNKTTIADNLSVITEMAVRLNEIYACESGIPRTHWCPSCIEKYKVVDELSEKIKFETLYRTNGDLRRGTIELEDEVYKFKISDPGYIISLTRKEIKWVPSAIETK